MGRCMEIKKKILITGGTGFQGSNLTKKLLNKGYDVVMLNTHSKKNETNIKRFKLHNAKIVWGNINDKKILEKEFQDINLIIHTAAKIHVDDSIKYPTEYFKTNVMGTNNVLEVARHFNIPVIHVSTCEVYGFVDEDLSENSPLMPRSPYAASKAGADRMAYSYYTTYNMNVCIVRPFNVYGPGQKDGECGAVIPRWATSLLNNKNIQIYGDGKQSREFIYIDDLVSAYEIIIDKMLSGNSLAGEVLNVGTGIDINIKYLAKELCNKTTNSYDKIIYSSLRPGEVKRFISNSDKMKLLDWSPKVDLSEGLDKYLKWRKQKK
jgi:dTDP-glucose 4,6-dehydratase